MLDWIPNNGIELCRLDNLHGVEVALALSLSLFFQPTIDRFPKPLSFVPFRIRPSIPFLPFFFIPFQSRRIDNDQGISDASLSCPGFIGTVQRTLSLRTIGCGMHRLHVRVCVEGRQDKQVCPRWSVATFSSRQGTATENVVV